MFQSRGRRGPQGNRGWSQARAGHRPIVQSTRPLDSFLQEPPPTNIRGEKLSRTIRELNYYYKPDVDLAEKLSPILRHTDFPPDFVLDTLAPCVGSENAALLMAGVLLAAAKRRGTDEIGNLWRKSELKWLQFLPQLYVEDFIKKHKLEFTMSPSVAEASRMDPPRIKALLQELVGENEPEIPAEVVTLNLKRLLIENRSNAYIIDWVDARGYKKKGCEENFIQILVSEVIESTIDMINRPHSLVEPKLKRRIPLLSHYIRRHENLELQALHAVQSVIYSTKEYGLYRPIFDIIYGDNLVTEESLDKWRSSNIIGETTKKRTAIVWTETFFKWLKEDNLSDEYEEVYEDDLYDDDFYD